MKLRISRPAAWSAAFVAIVARIFYALAVDGGTVHNGVWLSSLLGGLLALPMLICLVRLRKRPDNLPTLFLLLLFCVSVVDSGVVLSTIVRSSSFLAMGQVPTLALLLPVSLAMYWAISRNGNAVGYGATLFSRLFPALLLLVALLQWRHYRPAWLLPLLGNSWGAITRGGWTSACCFAPVVALPLLCEDEQKSPGKQHTVKSLSGSAAVAALLLSLRLMMAPMDLTGDSWTVRLDTLLTNGRAPLYLQLPMIVLWYAALLHLLAGEGFAAALLAQRLFPALDGRLCALLATFGTAFVAISPLPQVLPGSGTFLWTYLGLTILMLLCAALPCRAKGGHARCD